MDEAKELLTNQLTEEIRKLSTMEDGSEEKTATINGINQLYKLKIEEARLESEKAAQEVERTEQKRDRIFRYALDGALGVAPLIFYGIWMKRGFKFEETGTFTSSTFRGLTKFFKPTRR